jgi:beta-N-acetylhexosaminidase
LNDLHYDQKAFAISRARIQKLMPTSQAFSWDDLQASPDYQKAKHQLQSLDLINK